jgi:hypothetical protein
MTENPDFNDKGSNDYSLKSTSQAVDAGLNLSGENVQYDIEGKARPQGNAFDLGAYEYGSMVLPGNPDPPSNLRVSMNN